MRWSAWTWRRLRRRWRTSATARIDLVVGGLLAYVRTRRRPPPRPRSARYALSERMRKSPLTRREIVATLVSPALVAGTILCWILLSDTVGFPQFVIWLSLIYGYPLTLVAGVPLWLWCKRKYGISWPKVLVGGAVCGSIVPVLMYVPVLLSSVSTKNNWHTQEVVAELLRFALGGALLGIAIALTFRLVAGAPKSA